MSWITVLVVLLVLLVVAAAVLAFLKQREAAQKEAFEALAARRKWALNITEQSLGRPAILRLSARSGPGWVALARRSQGVGDSGPHARLTDFTGQEPRWTEGYLIVGPAPQTPSDDSESTGNAEKLTPRMLSNLVGDGMGADMNGMRLIEAPEGLTVMATADPRLRVDLKDLAKVLQSYDPQVTGPQGHPVMMLGPEGLRVRLRHSVKRADRMEAFVDLALTLTRTLAEK